MKKFEEHVRAYVADRRAWMIRVGQNAIDFRTPEEALDWIARFDYANVIVINFAESVGMIDEAAAKGLRTETNNTRVRAERMVSR